MFLQPDLHLVGMSPIGPSVNYLNGGHLFNLNTASAADLGVNVMLGRRITQDYIAFAGNTFRGFENLEHVTTASLLGIRESRRISSVNTNSTIDYMAARILRPDRRLQ